MTQGSGEDLSSMSMLDLFRMEAENHCATLTEDLLSLEQDPTAADRLESMMRAAHSVKGAARIVGVDPAVQVAHAMEDVFVAAQHGHVSLTRVHVDTLLQGVDLLTGIAHIAENEAAEWLQERRPQIETLVRDLAALTKRGEQVKVAAPAMVPAPLPEQKPAPPPSAPAPEAGPVQDSELIVSMFGLFRTETARHCAQVLTDLDALRKDSLAKDHLESCVRAIHAIKGTALLVGLEKIGRLSSAIEDLLISARQAEGGLHLERGTAVRQGIDLLNLLAKVSDAEVKQWLADQAGQIDALIDGLSGHNKTQVNLPVPAAPVKPKSLPAAPSQVEPVSAPVQPAPPPAAKSEKKAADRTLRVSAESMNRLMGLASDVMIESRWLPTFAQSMLRLKRRQDELVVLVDRIREESTMSDKQPANRMLDLRQKILNCCELTINSMTELEDHARRTTETSHRLYREVIANRMRPFADGIQGFPRMVRDVARELGKDVHLEIHGNDTLVDRDILDKIEAPLNHLLRNAVDHGIEMPADREKAGKKSAATVRLEATHRSGMLNITVADDGRGVDLEVLRKTVVARKLVSEEIAAVLSDAELMDFLFLPNFSTKTTVSKVSGRGVGLDVVHNVVHEVRGVVRAQTKLGQGTRFEMQLPLTLSVMRALLVEINYEPYAFPLVAIDHVLRVQRESIKEVEGRQYFILKEKRIGIVAARQILEKIPSQSADDELPIIVLSDRLNQYGLIIDRFLGIRDLVVQPLDSRFGKLKDISAAALLEDGVPVLIVDVEDMVLSMDGLISGNRIRRIDQGEEEKEKGIKRILVADDSITVREVERKMLVARGYEVDLAVDGMDAWNTVRAGNYNLVVTDVDMPRMNGIELVTMIKRDPNLQHLPVVIVSYKDREEDRNRGLEAGADYYLTKGSFQNETLVQAVQDLIGGPEVDGS